MPDGTVYTAEEQARRAAEADFRDALRTGNAEWFRTHLSQEQREAVVAMVLTPAMAGDSVGALALVQQLGHEEALRQFASALHGAEVMAEANPEIITQQLGLRHFVAVVLPELFDANPWLFDWEHDLRSRAELQPYFDLFAGVVAGTEATGLLLIAAFTAALLAVAAPAVSTTVAGAVARVAPWSVAVPGIPAAGITAADVSVPGLAGSLAGMGTFVGGLRLTEAAIPGAGGLVAVTMPIPVAAWEALKSVILLKSPMEFAQSLRAVFAMPWDPASAREGAIDTGEILRGLGLPDNEVSRGIADLVGMMIAAHAAGRFEALVSDPAFVAKLRALPAEVRDALRSGVDAYVAAGARGEVINPLGQILGEGTLEVQGGLSRTVAEKYPVAFEGPGGEVLVGSGVSHTLQVREWIAKGEITPERGLEILGWRRGFSPVEGPYKGRFLTLFDVAEIEGGPPSPISPPVPEVIPPSGTVVPPQVVPVRVGELEVKDTFQGPGGDRVIVAGKDAAGNVILKDGQTVTVPADATVPGREGSVVVGGALGLKDLPQSVKDAAARFNSLSQAELSALSPDEYAFLKNSADVVEYFRVGSTGAPSIGQASGLPEYLREWVVRVVRGETAPVVTPPVVVFPPSPVVEPGAVLASPADLLQWNEIGETQRGIINGLFQEAQRYGLGREFLDRLEFDLAEASARAGEAGVRVLPRESVVPVIQNIIKWLDSAKASVGAVGVPPAMPEVPEVGVEGGARLEQIFRDAKPADMSVTDWLLLRGRLQGIITGAFVPEIRAQWRELLSRAHRWREAGGGLEVENPYSLARQYYALVGKFLGDWYLRDRVSRPGLTFGQFAQENIESAMNSADLAMEARYGTKGYVPATTLYPESQAVAVQESKDLFEFFESVRSQSAPTAPVQSPAPAPFATRPVVPFRVPPSTPFGSRPSAPLGAGRVGPVDGAQKIEWLSDSPAVVNEIRAQLSPETIAELSLSGMRAVAAGKGEAWGNAVREDVAAAVDNARRTGSAVTWDRVLSNDLKIINERLMLPRNTAAVAEPVPESRVPVPPFVPEVSRAPRRRWPTPRMVQVLQSLGWTEAMREGMSFDRASEIIQKRLTPGAAVPVGGVPPVPPPPAPPVSGPAPEGRPTVPLEIGPVVSRPSGPFERIPGAAGEAARNRRIERIAEIGRTNPERAAEEAWRLPDDEQSAIGRLIGKGALGRQRMDAFGRRLVTLAAEKHGMAAALQWAKDHPRYALLGPLGLVSAVGAVWGFVFIQEWTAKEGLVEQLMFPLGMRIRQYQQTPSDELRRIIESDFATLRRTVPAAQAWVRKWAWLNPLNKKGWLTTAELWGTQLSQLEAQWKETLAAASAPVIEGETFEVMVTKIIDGDTIEISVHARDPVTKAPIQLPPYDAKEPNHARIRWSGIDTPDNVAGGGQVHVSGLKSELIRVDSAWKGIATESLYPLDGNWVKVTVNREKPFDTYRRIVGRVEFDGRDLELDLVRKGYAGAYPVPPFNQARALELKNAELAARNDRAGFWGAVPLRAGAKAKLLPVGVTSPDGIAVVRVLADASGVSLFDNDIYTGHRSPAVLELAPGVHRIRGEKGTGKNKVSASVVVEVKAGVNPEVTIHMPAGAGVAGFGGLGLPPVGGVAQPGASGGGPTMGNPFE